MSFDRPQKIQADHLKRDAFLYVRQSSLRQVFENCESTKRQYALRERAVALGWPLERIRTIDSDLGLSGAQATNRDGFQTLVSEVALGHAGIVLGLEVSRLARNNADWHRLLELAALAAVGWPADATKPCQMHAHFRQHVGLDPVQVEHDELGRPDVIFAAVAAVDEGCRDVWGVRLFERRTVAVQRLDAKKRRPIKDLVETRSTGTPFESAPYTIYANLPHVVPQVSGGIAAVRFSRNRIRRIRSPYKWHPRSSIGDRRTLPVERPESPRERSQMGFVRE